jgi:hypothetical protein
LGDISYSNHNTYENEGHRHHYIPFKEHVDTMGEVPQVPGNNAHKTTPRAFLLWRLFNGRESKMEKALMLFIFKT